MLQSDNIKSVSQINLYIKNLFQGDYNLARVKVLGEVSNCKYHSSGHIYFSLKDRTATISCVMFASDRVSGLSFDMKDGDSVVVSGRISVYERDGKYQIYVRSVEKQGKGDLYEEFEKIKKRLTEEGLFDDSIKQIIPPYAMKIGIVTSRTGAVIRDIVNVSTRRNPYVELFLYPASVQGEGAHKSIIKGIEYFNNTDVDTIIIGRGGGSIEDLWEFNNIELAYAIVDSVKPIISAVGHETDFCISDFVSDLRAPTPSAAAELAVFRYDEFICDLEEYKSQFTDIINQKIDMYKERLNSRERLLYSYSPQELINQKKIYVDSIQEKLNILMEIKIKDIKSRLVHDSELLDAFSPLKKLESGFSYVSTNEGKRVKDIDDIEVDDDIELYFKSGKAKACITGIEESKVHMKGGLDG